MVGKFPLLNWNIWNGEAAAWNVLLAQFPDCNVYQSYGWGEYKRTSGWLPYRFTATDRDKTVAMAQVLVRRYPLSVSLAWVSGGPIGSAQAWGDSFRKTIRRYVGTCQLYCRINALREHTEPELEILRAAGWESPGHPLGSGKSILLDLRADDQDWLRSIDGKHRYYVKKSSASRLEWVHGNTEELRRDLAALTRRLNLEKGMKLPEWDTNAIENLNRSIPDAVYVLVGYIDAQPVTGCLVLVQGTVAYYVSAATLKAGREVSAAYSMFSKIRSFLHGRGILVLDFGGINPSSENARGVDHFKRGFGGREIRYLGEWDWATSSPLRHAANYLIKRHAQRM